MGALLVPVQVKTLQAFGEPSHYCSSCLDENPGIIYVEDRKIATVIDLADILSFRAHQVYTGFLAKGSSHVIVAILFGKDDHLAVMGEGRVSVDPFCFGKHFGITT